MKLILAVVLAGMLCGCAYEPTVSKIGNQEVVVIDGCEYLKFYTYGGFCTYTHKGNCKNPIHIYKQEN